MSSSPSKTTKNAKSGTMYTPTAKTPMKLILDRKKDNDDRAEKTTVPGIPKHLKKDGDPAVASYLVQTMVHLTNLQKASQNSA